MNIDELLIEEIRASNADRKSWTGTLGGTTVTMYAKPMCPADFEYVAKRGYRDFLANPTMGGMIEMIVRKAEHEDGKKMFPSPNKTVPLLSKIGNTKVASIFTELFSEDMVSETSDEFEERVGN